MIILNGIGLNPNMIWLERFKPDPVAMTTRRILRGRVVVFSGSLLKGEKLTLEATLDHGWLTYDTVLQLVALAEQSGMVYEMTFDGETFLVMFDHTRPPAVDFQAIVERVTHDPGDYFYGQLKFITV